MHELSITHSLLNLALSHAETAGAKKIIRLNLVIGQMSNIVDESVQFYWDTIAQNTPAEGATLIFNRLPALFHCHNCAQDFKLDDSPSFICPHCQSVKVQLTGGDEFRLESIEVE